LDRSASAEAENGMIQDFQASASDLHRRLTRKNFAKNDSANALLLISLSILPLGDADDTMWLDLDEALTHFKTRYEGSIYRLSQAERAVLVEATDFNRRQQVTDLKVALLRIIQAYFPNNFGMVDQSRLLRAVDLDKRHTNAVTFVERYIAAEDEAAAAAPAAETDAPPPTGEAPASETPAADAGPAAPQAAAPPTAVPHTAKRRPLGEPDIRMVEQVTGEIGSDAFAKVFLTHQPVVRITPDDPTPHLVFEEIFVAMNALKEHVFQNVELRGSGNLFNQLTITLDRLLVASLGTANAEKKPCSINLNVETVFSRDFQAFMEAGGDDAFAHVTFEFRQANVLQHFDEFAVAVDLIEQKQGAIAVDAIFPETVGVLNVDRLKAGMAKIFWRPGADLELDNRAADVKRLIDSGVEPVLARLDDPAGIELAHELGITLFQGFHIDDLLKDGDKA
jgi:hypothetical protein